jgi:hypothetical protein
MTHRRQPEATVLPVHFEDRSGSEFERLCFAYLLRAFDWNSIAWYGQLGGDAGRDIWAVRKTGEAECQGSPSLIAPGSAKLIATSASSAWAR